MVNIRITDFVTNRGFEFEHALSGIFGFFGTPPTHPGPPVSPRGLSGFGINFRDPPPKLLEIAVNPRGLSDFGKKYPPPPQKLLKK